MFFKDLTAGIIVGIVALPLAIAFGIASGVTPEQGLYTAIVAGFIISVLSGSRVQIGGPTGAFIVIIYSIIQKFGYDGLAIATVIAGILLVIMGLVKMGAVLKFIPYPVTVGLPAASPSLSRQDRCATFSDSIWKRSRLSLLKDRGLRRAYRVYHAGRHGHRSSDHRDRCTVAARYEARSRFSGRHHRHDRARSVVQPSRGDDR
jgi:hypothetical protein